MKLKVLPLAITAAGVLALSSCGDDDNVAGPRSDGLFQSLGVLRETWTLASPPLAEPDFGTDRLRSDRGTASDGAFSGLSDPAIIWTNPYPQFLDTAIYVRDPDRADPRQHNTHVLIMEFRPHRSPTITAER